MIGHYCLDDVIGIHGDVLNSSSTIVIHKFLESKEYRKCAKKHNSRFYLTTVFSA